MDRILWYLKGCRLLFGILFYFNGFTINFSKSVLQNMKPSWKPFWSYSNFPCLRDPKTGHLGGKGLMEGLALVLKCCAGSRMLLLKKIKRNIAYRLKWILFKHNVSGPSTIYWSGCKDICWCRKCNFYHPVAVNTWGWNSSVAWRRFYTC